METKEKLGREEVIEAAREGKKEIKQETRAAKQELKKDFQAFKEFASPEDIEVAREARMYAKQDIEQDSQDGRDSIDDLRDEYLDGKSRSARKTIGQIEDVVAETALDLDSDLY